MQGADTSQNLEFDATTSLNDQRATVNAYQKVLTFAKSNESGIIAVIGAKGSGKNTLIERIKKAMRTKTIISYDVYDFVTDQKLDEACSNKIKASITEKVKNQSSDFILILKHYEALYLSNSKYKLDDANDLLSELGLQRYKNIRVIVTCQRGAISDGMVSYRLTWASKTFVGLSLLPWNQTRIQDYVQKKHPNIKYCGPFDIPIGAVQVVIETSRKHQPRDFTMSWAWHTTFLEKWIETPINSIYQLEEEKLQKIMQELAMTMFVKHTSVMIKYTTGTEKHPL